MNAAALSMPSPPAAPCVRDALAAHREHLLRFARRRLRDGAAAEDVVQDVFEAVLRRQAAFAGRSSLRTWLTGVLKHKIVDRQRRQRDHGSLDDADDGAGAAALGLRCPQPLPDEVADQRQRLRRTLERIEALPPALREVVQRRLLDGQDTGEICRALGITETNLFVRLHRARRRLCA
jgi:RNA polymerase sigma-70 factor (ECF subfamily)